MDFKDELDRELAVGDTVLTSYRAIAVVVGFTAKKVRLAHYHKQWSTGIELVAHSSYNPDSLLILREESFSDCERGHQLAFLRASLGFS